MIGLYISFSGFTLSASNVRIITLTPEAAPMSLSPAQWLPDCHTGDTSTAPQARGYQGQFSWILPFTLNWKKNEGEAAFKLTMYL